MDARQSFKFGFLMECTQAGLTPSEMEAGLDTLIKTGMFDMASKVLDTVVGVGGLGLAGAGILGAGAGYMLGNATEQPIDPEEVKKREMISVLQQYAAQARRNSSRIQYRQPQSRLKPPSLFPV